ncbi:hypothetical protein SAMN05216168_2122 [Kosakonia radicincitans]|nr:hypothetical protein SAMN05216168_2122 [Kosakonia radicincitans]
MHTLGMITGAAIVFIIYFLVKKRRHSATGNKTQKKQN